MIVGTPNLQKIIVDADAVAVALAFHLAVVARLKDLDDILHSSV